MNYTISIITLEKGSEILERERLTVSSEKPLTVAQVKERCLAALALDELVWTRSADELWTRNRNSKEYTALADDLMLTEYLHTDLQYYLKVTKK